MPLYKDFPQGVLTPGFLEGVGQPPPIPGLTDQGPLSAQLPPINTPVSQPQVPPAKRPGFFGRIMQQPGGSRALLALGASLLSNQNFAEGLGQGAMAYQATLDQERDRLAPRLTKDGTFTYKVDPNTGEIVFDRTPVADYEEGIVDKRLKTTLAGIGLREDGQTRRQELKLGYEERRDNADRKYRYDALDVQQSMNRLDNDTDMAIAELNNRTAIEEANIRSSSTQGKPPSATALKMYDEHRAAVKTGIGTIEQGNKILGYLESGSLDLGLVSNLYAKGAAIGALPANDTTRQYAELEQFTQQLVNTVLMDARGVQTDGDAVRAKIMSLVSSGDAKGAAQEIRNVLGMVRRTTDFSQVRSAALAQQYGILEQAAPQQAPPSNRSNNRPQRRSPSVSNW